MVVIFGEMEHSGAGPYSAWWRISAPGRMPSGRIGLSQSRLDASRSSVVNDNDEHTVGDNLFRVSDADWRYQEKDGLGSVSPANQFFGIVLECLPGSTARCAPL